jgi:hypothetical protein
VTLGAGGVEARFVRDGALHLQQHVPERLDQVERERRQDHAASDDDEELVLKHSSQPPQSPAHRRLAQVHAPAGSRHIPLGQQSIQSDEEVEIEPL